MSSYEFMRQVERNNNIKTNRILELSNIINYLKHKLTEFQDIINKFTTENENLKTDIKNKENTIKTLENKYRCVICYEKCKNIVLEPCSHFVCCKECSESLLLCPICRGEFESRLLVFGD